MGASDRAGVIIESEEPVDEGVSTRRGRGGDSILVDLVLVGLLGFMTSKCSDILMGRLLHSRSRLQKYIY